MATIGVLSVALVANNSKFNRGMDDASRRTRRFGGQMDTLKARVAGATASLRTMGTVAAGFAVVKLAKGVENFNRKMLNSQAIMGDLTDGQMRRMQKVAIDTAKVTSASSGDVADSFFFLASAGLDAEQSMASVGQVALFAQAGMFDMARATDLATDAQSALGMTVPDAQRNLENLTRVTDVLVKANTLANGSVEQFSEALTNKFGASLRVAGKSIEEGVALLAAFADQGIKGAEAGTAQEHGAEPAMGAASGEPGAPSAEAGYHALVAKGLGHQEIIEQLADAVLAALNEQETAGAERSPSNKGGF